jgi:hypothetical protein
LTTEQIGGLILKKGKPEKALLYTHVRSRCNETFGALKAFNSVKFGNFTT